MRGQWFVVLAGLVGLATGAAGCSKRADSAKRSAASGGEAEALVARGDLERVALLTGELDAVNSVDIVVPQTESWQLTISWMVEDGARLKKGDRVVEFDNSAFTNQLESNRLLVKQARRDYATGRHLRAMTVADRENAVTVAELERDKAAIFATVDRTLISERDFQERQLALERAEATLLSARADLKSSRRAANLDLEVKRIAAEKAERAVATAEHGIELMAVTAPEDGVAMVSTHPWIGTKLLAGDTVQPGWTAVKLPDLSELIVTATLSDVDDGQVEVGMSATVVFDSDPSRVVRGKVSAVSAVAGEVANADLLRAFVVEVALEGGGGSWARPGMSARVEVETHAVRDALLIPRAALGWQGETSAVTTSAGDDIAVEVIHCNTQSCAIKDGPVEVGAALKIGGAK